MERVHYFKSPINPVNFSKFTWSGVPVCSLAFSTDCMQQCIFMAKMVRITDERKIQTLPG